MTRATLPLFLALTGTACLPPPPADPLPPELPARVDTITITRITVAPRAAEDDSPQPPTAEPAAEPPLADARDAEPRLAGVPLHEDRPTMICLATGHSVRVFVSAAGDTLIGPRRVPLVHLGPLVGFVGTYAASEAWFVHDQPLRFDGRTFSKAGRPVPRDCHDITRVGEFEGVNLFADGDADPPPHVLHVPVQPGVFQTYRSGTRHDRD